MPLTALWTRTLYLGLLLAAALQAQAGPPGASVNALHAVDGATRTVYAATDTGVYRSRDDGATWEAFSEGLPIDEHTVESITGVNNQLFAAVPGAGAWRRRDGGVWQQASSGLDDLNTLAVAAKPGDPRTVLAGTASQGIFQTTDGGDGWTRLGGAPALGAFTEIAHAPNDSQRILAVSNPGQVFESRDGGQSWTPRAGDPRVLLTGIAFDPSNPDVAYFSTSIGLFRQAGPGQNLAGLPVTAFIGFTDIAVDPANSNVLYAAHQRGVVVSPDQGATIAAAAGLPQAGGFELLALKGEPTRVLAGAFGTGIFASEDQGATFRLSSIGMNGGDILSIAVDPRKAGVVYASMSGGGMFKTVNGGDSWREARQGLAQFNPVKVLIDPADSNRLYSGAVNPSDRFDGSLARSEDAGATWESLLIGGPALGLAVHPTDGQTVWYGTSSGPFATQPSLYRSRDRGENWQIFLDTLNIRGIALDPSNPRNVYAISELSGIYELIRSGNEGDDFSGTGQTRDIQMFTVVVDPVNPRTVYLGTSQGVYRSSESGLNFQPRSTGLPDNGAVAVVSLAIDPRDGAIYIATSAGVFKSTNSAGTWAALGTGLENVLVREVAIDPHTPNGLYAATAGAGVYRSTNGGATWAPTGTKAAIISRESVVNAADFKGGGVAPGELATIFGQGIGPTQGVQATALDPATGKLPTELAGVRVFFNDISAPLLFVRSDQVNVQVPFEIAGLNPARVNIRVEFDGLVSNTVQVAALATHPGLFPTAVNLNGSLNSEAARTPAGEYALFYATGQGATNPAVETGALPPAAEPLARSVALARVRINNQETEVYFAGLAYPYVGLLQLNVKVPAGLAPGRYDVELRIGERPGGALGKIWVGP